MSDAAATTGGGGDLQARLRFERFLANLGSRFLRSRPEALRDQIEQGLREVLDVLDVERVAVALFSLDGKALVVEHTCSRPGIPNLAGVDLAVPGPWYTEQVRRGRRLAYTDMAEELPQEAVAEKQFVRATGLRSHVALPLVVGEQVLGGLGVGALVKPTRWSPEFLSRFELLASMMARAVYRYRAEQRIGATEELNRAILRALPNEVLVLDGEGRVLSMNDSARRSAGEERASVPDLPGVRSVLARESASFEATYAEPGPGGVRHRLLHAVPLEQRRATIVVQTDVTELQRTKAELERTVQELEELKDRLEAENVLLQREVRHVRGFETIVGRSAALGRVLSQVEQVAPTDAPVLLLGETGTGKDLVARALHDRSRRRERPMVSVNCAALPATLIESELFGYERGAFTGALQRTIGRFEVADGGTIFLDEVGELPLALQAKLLRVLQSGEFERLGSPRTITTNVRLVAATNRDLEREMREGRFRPDLYYRLSVFPVSLPPLRDRPEDIPLLVWHFVALKQAKLGRQVKRIPERLMRTFTTYAWPGNVRELENVVERALILTEGQTLAADPSLFAGAHEDLHAAGGGTLEDVERAHIRAVLDECDWKVAGPGNAAERLGLNRSTLQFRMRKLGIERPARERRQDGLQKLQPRAKVTP